MRFEYHEDGTQPLDCHSVFVFGSNRAGRHGAGAAKAAKLLFGAKAGVGEGACGRSYAIPTKDENIVTLPLDEVKEGIQRFLAYARERENVRFWVTRIGCGLAGYDDVTIAPLFANATKNCHMPLNWKPFLD